VNIFKILIITSFWAKNTSSIAADISLNAQLP